MPRPDPARQILILLIGRFVSDFGRGFTLAFAPIYFEKVVGLSGTVIGLGVCGNALLMGAAALAGAYFTDRFGRVRSLRASMLSSAAVNSLFVWVTEAWAYVVVCVLAGGALALYWPASTAMLTDLSPPHQRARVFARLRVAINAGVGLGVLGAGVLIEVLSSVLSDPAAPYKALFLIDAGTYLVFYVLLRLGVEETLPQATGEVYGGFRKGWGAALRDSRLRALAPLNVCFVLCYSQFLVGFPLFFDRWVGLEPLAISSVFLLNTLVIVFLQLPLWSLVNAWRRTRTLAVAAALFAAGFVVLNLCALEGASGLAVVLASMALLSAGEMLHGPAVSSLFGSLAPSHLRGTYMSVETLCWSAGLAAGPVLTGALLDAGRAYLLWNLLAAVVAAAIAGWSLLGRSLSDDVDRPLETT
jgi:MFS family permease